MARHKYTVIHHSVTDFGTGKNLTDYHLVLDIVDAQIKIYEHIPHFKNTVRAVGGANSLCYSVCLVGHYHKNKVSSKLLKALINALAVKIKADSIPALIVGHRDLGRMVGYRTECPGRFLYSQLEYIKKEVLLRI